MKYLTFILSFYILALNFVPCGDAVVDSNEVKIEMSNHGDDHDHSNADLCSPFCQCHCCHVHATHFDLVEYQVPNFDIPTNIFIHFNSEGKNFTRPLLQPPRV
ncbi:DUF6660 family protein [Mangrovimonas aestuarii]|uniref:DUF6660 family protein n=1 Tax=Mangrovimonas aestuarii TaxID=3018443 RepID=UPI0029E7DE11|nr:DUF6660 family protein [Mangrovimonas aestuarii]